MTDNVLPYTSGTFSLDDDEIDKAQEWLKKHARSCPHLRIQGAFGSPLMYTFRPHGLGVEVELVCHCGEKVHLSDPEKL